VSIAKFSSGQCAVQGSNLRLVAAATAQSCAGDLAGLVIFNF